MTLQVEKMSWEYFELLCAKLLEAEGYKVQELERRGRDIGIDFELLDSDNKKIAVEVKFFKKPRTSTRHLRDTASQLKRSAELISADRIFFVTSLLLPEHIRNDISSLGVEIKDSRWLRSALSNSPDIEEEFSKLITVQENIKASLGENPKIDERAEELIAKVKALECGKGSWKDYENLCIDILNYLFIPPFKVPKIQSRSEDGLDRRDAIYPIGNGNSFWDEIKKDTHSRFAVSEFKNYCESPSQKEVESIQQYLFMKAKRMFGILCCRLSPSDSALKARRRAWMEFDKLIVFLSDDDLIDMLNIKGAGEDPTSVIDSQLEEFFLELAP